MSQRTHVVSSASVPLIELTGIHKSYNSIAANQGIGFAVGQGEIHALLGENGAGKSTLMKIIYGVTKPDSGQINWLGKPVHIDKPSTARRLGIGMVFQHFTLFDSLSVVENISLASQARESISALSRRIVDQSQRYGLSVDPNRLVADLSVGERQRVEIVRCLLQDPRLLIMDEPTSVLSPNAIAGLFKMLRALAAEGRSVIYISHKLDEVRTLCDTATVIRMGRVVGSCKPSKSTAAAMARMMIGHDFERNVRRPAGNGVSSPALILRKLKSPAPNPFAPDLVDIDLTVHCGEIVGIAGVSGNGQSQLLEAVSGESLADAASSVEICGFPAGRADPLARRRIGLSYVPEDRLGQGAVPSLSMTDNGVLTGHGLGSVRSGWIRKGVAKAFAQSCISEFDVRSGRPNVTASTLSGGNLQKFILGRELLQNPKVLLIGQPTWGLDIGSATFVRRQIVSAARDKGAAVLVVSEELEELFEICDRIAVMVKGRLSPALPVDHIDTETIGLLMGGADAGTSTATGSKEPSNAY